VIKTANQLGYKNSSHSMHRMLAIHNQRSPSYPSDTVQTVVTATTRCGLRSSATTDYVVPRTISKFGERAFEYAGPAAWNRLPEHICRQFTPTALKKTFENVFLLKFLTLPRTLNIVMSAGHLCKWTQNRWRRRWWWWCANRTLLKSA